LTRPGRSRWAHGLLRHDTMVRGRVRAFLLVGSVAAATVFVPRPALGYSVLAHEAHIDALWDSTIKPLLRARFPRTTADQLDEARAYAYGWCVIQDLGYY